LNGSLALWMLFIPLSTLPFRKYQKSGLCPLEIGKWLSIGL